MSDNKEIADKLRALAAQDTTASKEQAKSDEYLAMAEQLDPATPPAPPAPAPEPPPAPTPPPAGTLRAAFEGMTGMHVAYRSVPESLLAGLPQTDYPEGSSGPMAKDETGGGARGALGIVSDYSVIAVASGDPRAEKYVDIVSKVAASMPIHWADPKTGQPVVFLDRPHASINASSTNDTDLTPDPATKWGFKLDLQHGLHFLFVPMLRAIKDGDTAAKVRILNEMKHYVAFNYLLMTDTARGFEKGIFNTAASVNDLRGSGWGVLPLAQTLPFMDRNDPMFASMVNSLEWNAKWQAGTFVPGVPVVTDDAWGGQYYNLPEGRFKNTLTIFAIAHPYDLGDGFASIGFFQHNFFVQAWQFIYGLAKRGNLPISNEAVENTRLIATSGAKFTVRMFGDGKQGRPDFRRAGRFQIVVGHVGTDGFIDPFTTDEELAAANDAPYGALPENENPPILRYHRYRITDPEGDQGPIGDGYYADAIPVLANAVRDDVPGGREALDRFKSSKNFQETKGSISYSFAYDAPGEYFDGAPVVVDPPAPPAPGPVAVNPPLNTRLAGEGEPFVLVAPALVRYGGGDKWVEKQLPAGSYVADNNLFGDPGYGIVKAVFIGGVGPTVIVPPVDPPVVLPPVDVTHEGFELGTEFLTDTDDGRPSEFGSVYTQPYPADYVHSIAHPPVSPLPYIKGAVKALPPGKGWREVLGTALEPRMSPELGSGSVAGVMATWNGGAFIEALQTLILPPGGGHMGNDNVAYWGIDIDNLEAFEYFKPRPLVPAGGGDSKPGPDYPQAGHMFGTPVGFKDVRDGKWKVFHMWLYDPFIFDPAAVTVERGTRYLVKQDVYAEQWTGERSCTDDSRGIIFHHTTSQSNQLSHYEPGRNRWFDHGGRFRPENPTQLTWGGYGGATYEMNGYSQMKRDPVRDRLVLFGKGDGLGFLDLSKDALSRPNDIQPFKAEAAFAEVLGDFGGEMSFDWDAEHKDWIVVSNQGVFSLTPDTYVPTLLTREVPPLDHNGMWGRLFYNAKRGETMMVAATKSNLFTFKR